MSQEAAAARWVAIDTGGYGEIWGFISRGDAYLHPIVQYGDALLGSPRDVLDQYNATEWRALWRIAMQTLPPPELVARIQSSDVRVRRKAMEDTAETIWKSLLLRAMSPPTDYRILCEKIARSRRTDQMAAKKNAAGAPPANTAPAADAAAPAAPAAPAEPKFRGPKGLNPTDVLLFGKDKDGKDYGPDHCPKRPGSKAATMWALYTSGMTVKAALDSGVSSEDLAWNIDKGFVLVEGRAATQAAPTDETAPTDDQPATADAI